MGATAGRTFALAQQSDKLLDHPLVCLQYLCQFTENQHRSDALIYQQGGWKPSCAK